MPETIIYRTSGKGRKIILLHGFCESMDVWNKIIPPLSERYEVLTPDLPGFGGSPLPPQPITIESIAEKISGWIRSITNEKVLVIGHSLGGYITLALAENHPYQVKAIGLINSTAYPDDEEKKKLRLKTIDFVEKNGKEKFLGSFVPGLFYNSGPETDELIAEAHALALKTSENSIFAYTLAMRNRPSRIHILKEANFPFLFIGGKNDQLIPAEKSVEQIGLLKKGYLIEDSGHMSMFEKPDEVATRIIHFAEQYLKP